MTSLDISVWSTSRDIPRIHRWLRLIMIRFTTSSFLVNCLSIPNVPQSSIKCDKGERIKFQVWCSLLSAGMLLFVCLFSSRCTLVQYFLLNSCCIMHILCVQGDGDWLNCIFYDTLQTKFKIFDDIYHFYTEVKSVH